MPDNTEKVSIAWHPAFCSAAEYDLRAERENLQFDSEHNLSKEPLRMDLLIIKKNTDEPSSNDIARIFRKYNVIEYKSPDDGLTIDDFYKTMAYACLYKASGKTVNEVPANELTVSVFRETYPGKLIQMLEEDGAIVEMTAPGVYEVKSSNFFFPAQIVVTKDLDVKKHASLRILSRNAKIEDVEQFLKESEKADTPWERENISSILEVSISANRQTFEKFKRRDSTMCDALRDLMKDEIEEELEKERAEEREETQKKNAFKFYQQGNSPEFIADFLEFPVEQVKKWLGLEKA
jgi:hypothetical protein